MSGVDEKGRRMLKEFREFAMKGNVVDLAVGVIIGAAFGKIVDSVVGDLIMPIVNFIAGGQVDFSNKYLVLSGNVPPGAALAEAKKQGNAVVATPEPHEAKVVDSMEALKASLAQAKKPVAAEEAKPAKKRARG